MIRRISALAALLAVAGAAPAQTSISTAHKYGWQENCGWMNWRDAGPEPGSDGVRVHATFLSGWIWLENAGWVTVGNGTPGFAYADCNGDGTLDQADFGCFQTRFALNDPYVDCTRDGDINIADFGCFQTRFAEGVNGSTYTNLTGRDAGVNIREGDVLEGFAWGENVGWINFGSLQERAPGFGVTLDRFAFRFRGYAWGENIGWVNLDDARSYVGLRCYVDCDDDGVATTADFGCFQTRFAEGDPYADCNRDGVLNVADFGCFQTRFAFGCR